MTDRKITPTDLLAWAVINKETEKEDPTVNNNLEPIDPKWIEVILGKPDSARMKEILGQIKESPEDVQLELLDELEMLVEQSDNANDLQPLGLWPELSSLLQNQSPKVRKNAAWVMATAIQNNTKAQDDFAKSGALLSIMKLFQLENDMQVRLKALLCVSAAIRHNHANFTTFAEHGGFTILANLLKDGNQAILKRAVFLFTALLQEETDTGVQTAQMLSKDGIVDMVLDSFSNLELDEDTVEQCLYFLLACANSRHVQLSKDQVKASLERIPSTSKEIKDLVSELEKTI